MKRKIKALVMSVLVSVIFLSSGCTTEHYTYAGPYDRVVIVKQHPRVYRVKRHPHRIIYYYQEGAVAPDVNSPSR